MFDRVDPGAQCGVDPVHPVGVGGDLSPEHVRGLDNGAHLVLHHLLSEAARDVGQHASGRSEFDHVGAGSDLLAGGAAAVFGAVAEIAEIAPGDLGQAAVDPVALIAMPARNRDHSRCHDHGWTDELARCNGIAKRANGGCISAKIANRSKAREQGLVGVGHRRVGLVLVVAVARLKPCLQAVIEPAQVDVHVDQAGHQSAIAKFDHPGPGNVDEAVADFADLAALDDHRDVAANRLTRDRDQGSGVDHGDGRGRVCRRVRGLGGDLGLKRGSGEEQRGGGRKIFVHDRRFSRPRGLANRRMPRAAADRSAGALRDRSIAT